MNHTNEEVERVAEEIDRIVSPHINGLVSYGACLNAVSKYHLTKLSEVEADSARKTAAFNEGAKFSMELMASLQSENQRMRDLLKECIHPISHCTCCETMSHMGINRASNLLDRAAKLIQEMESK